MIEILPLETKYKYFTYQNGPLLVAANSSINKIVFKNGIVKFFSDENSLSGLLGKGADTLKNESDLKLLLAIKGEKDAEIFYVRNAVGAACGVTTFLCPPCGLIASAACASQEPRTGNLNYPNQELFSNLDYQKAYRNKAHKIKKEKIWNGFGYGFVSSILLGFSAYVLINK